MCASVVVQKKGLVRLTVLHCCVCVVEIVLLIEECIVWDGERSGTAPQRECRGSERERAMCVVSVQKRHTHTHSCVFHPLCM